MSTIKDVAKIAGVSVSTVSRVLSGSGPSAASDKTKEKIWEAVRICGYSVNKTAQNLRKNKKTSARPEHAIDCILARELEYFIDPFLSSLRRVIEENLFRYEYRLRAQFGLSDLSQHLNPEDQKRDAAIILGRIDASGLKVLKNNYRHLIYVGLQDLDLEIDSVICSGYDSVGHAMDYLFSLGHKKICYLGETKNEQRYNAYLDKLQEYNLPSRRDLVVDVFFTPNDSYEGLKRALDTGIDCTAILCANDTSVFGVLKVLKEYHKDVPYDISVIGINDMENNRYLEPMLTSVAVPIDEMGKHVVKLLIDRIEGGHRAPVKLYLPSSLVKRESCTTL